MIADVDAFHRASMVVDFHMDLPSRLLGEKDPDPAKSGAGQVDLPKLRAGGVKGAVMALYTPDALGEDPVRRTLRMIDIVHEMAAHHPEEFALCRTGEEIRRAAARGAIGLVLSIENGVALAGRLALLRIYHRLGVQAVGLVWNGRNEIADGCMEARGGGRLTAFGVEVVQEMGRLGMIVDVSHLSEAGFWDVLEQARGRVIASHSNARAVRDHPRNLSDDQIRALTGRGGVMGMNFCKAFLTDQGDATVDDIRRHVDHIAGLVGMRAVALGSDYDGMTGPKDMPDASTFPVLTRALAAAGYGEEALRDILGENWLRLLDGGGPKPAA